VQYLKKFRYIWLLPSVALIFGLVIVIWTGLERHKVHQELAKVLEEHVTSVAQLIWEGTREATAAIDQIYALSEDGLATTVRLLGQLGQDFQVDQQRMDNAGILVWVRDTAPGQLSGYWGPVPLEQRELVVKEVNKADPGEIVETQIVRTLGLYCAHYMPKWGKVIVCKSIDGLSSVRREIGLGPLLRNVLSHGVIYAVIQDETGILAGSSAGQVSDWKVDAQLEEVRHKSDMDLVFRIVESKRGELFEGLGPFPLPDGSLAVLRVGVDAIHMVEVQKGVNRRHQLLLIVVGLLFVLSFSGSWFLSRWAKRRQEIESVLAAREEQNRHWQAIGQMAATVAHEVRSPLNTLKMVAQRMGREFDVGQADKVDYQELVELLKSEADRVNNVVTEFLELGKPLRLKYETVQILEVLNQAIASSILRAEQESKSLLTSFACSGEISLDRHRFIQIISNLLDNALDAVAKGGMVHVDANCVKSSGELCIEIKDNGPGMDDQALNIVKNSFVTTKSSGTGLGLPLAIRLTEAHNGKLTLKSEPGYGTTVSVRLPGYV
jgi:signal transduction histidine kinase